MTSWFLDSRASFMAGFLKQTHIQRERERDRAKTFSKPNSKNGTCVEWIDVTIKLRSKSFSSHIKFQWSRSFLTATNQIGWPARSYQAQPSIDYLIFKINEANVAEIAIYCYQHIDRHQLWPKKIYVRKLKQTIYLMQWIFFFRKSYANFACKSICSNIFWLI